jgi:putative pyruvate formate lyase activating enzyme
LEFDEKLQALPQGVQGEPAGGRNGILRCHLKAQGSLLSSAFRGGEAPGGGGGSGTIFLGHCKLGCVFCQNWDISHGGAGTDCEIEDLADMMLQLQEQGCHNINIVN